jgi:uncharacterized protein YbjT (DUF2867 family)
VTSNGARLVTVFGGTGFLGRRVVRHLRGRGVAVRVASRHRERARELFGESDAGLHAVEADIHHAPSVADALAGAHGAVNAVSLYVEQGSETFDSVHVEAARRVATEARRAGIARLAHVSGIGSDAASPSLYIRKRGEGEIAVRDVFADTTLIRPAVMFGEDDSFLTTLVALVRRLPVVPLFGRGETKLQPAFVEDVAEAIARVVGSEARPAPVYECGGPRVYEYKELLRSIGARSGAKPWLAPTPFALWRLLARVAAILPHPPVTISQVELMEVDNLVSPDAAGFADLGIAPRPIDEVLSGLLGRRG